MSNSPLERHVILQDFLDRVDGGEVHRVVGGDRTTYFHIEPVQTKYIDLIARALRDDPEVRSTLVLSEMEVVDGGKKIFVKAADRRGHPDVESDLERVLAELGSL